MPDETLTNSPAKRKRRRHVPQRGASHVYWSETKSGKVFEVRHPRNAEGKRLFETVGSRLDVAKARAREIHGGTAPPVSSVGMTVADLLARYRAMRELSDDEQRILKLHIEPRWNRTKLREITWSDIASWWPSLKRQDGKPGPLAEGTQRLILARFSGLLEYGIEIGALGVNPVKQIPRKRRPKQGEARRRILTPGEEQRLLAYAASRPWLQEIIAVALAQALRLGEVLALQVPEVDEALRTGKLRVRYSLDRDGVLGATKHQKLTGKRDPRDVTPIDLMPAAREVFLNRRMEVSEGFLFRNRLGGRRERRDVQRGYSLAVERAALPETQDGRPTFHALRHTAISRLSNEPRVGVVYAMQFAGHSDLSVTQNYIHHIESAERTSAAAEALGGAA